MIARLRAVEALVTARRGSRRRGPEDARELSTAAKVVASDTAVWAVDRAARLAASRSYAAGDELARLRRDAPQTQIGEGANDALLLALARPHLDGVRHLETWGPTLKVPDPYPVGMEFLFFAVGGSAILAIGAMIMAALDDDDSH